MILLAIAACSRLPPDMQTISPSRYSKRRSEVRSTAKYSSRLNQFGRDRDDTVSLPGEIVLHGPDSAGVFIQVAPNGEMIRAGGCAGHRARAALHLN